MINRILALSYSGFIQLLRSRIYLNLLVTGVFLVGISWAVNELSGGMSTRVTLNIGLALCSIVTVILAGITSIVGVTRQMETQEIHLILARPMARFEFVIARFLTGAALVLLSNALFGVLLGALIYLTDSSSAWRVVAASLFVSFEGFIIISIALFFGVKSSSAMSAVFTTTLFLLGRLSLSILELIQSGKFIGASKTLLEGVYAILPHLFAFDLSAWARTGHTLSTTNVIQSAAYGILYSAAFVSFSSLRLQNKDLL